MKRLGLVLLAMVILVGFSLNDAQAQGAKLKGECYLAVINFTDMPLKEVWLNGHLVKGPISEGMHLMSFECTDEIVHVEVCLDGATIFFKDIKAKMDPKDRGIKFPANYFIWRIY